ncbi:G2/M phase-specific E3 ubiquitin-protein ligase-like [Carassius carassius]|uniref:G2/M phase-specific E3 ubiquitin-protein ligase-like n=1 Tax=Carassius carassius TaxID=217509 RepID=UPI0028689D57|nr:G2/M phase-specific E3 ubiquitin-protein ligase-like [Carassius carassius]
MLQTAGCYQCLRTLGDKEKVVDGYIQWYFTYRNHVSFQRFKDGLATLNFFNALEQHPSIFLPYMCYSAEDLTAESVESLFRPQLSPTGSSNRGGESAWLLAGLLNRCKRGRVRDVSGGHSNVCNRPERNPSSKINTKVKYTA